MPKKNGRYFILPVVALLTASSCTLTNRKNLDKIRYQVRNQQHVLTGQTKMIEELTQERDSLKEDLNSQLESLKDQALLLKVTKDRLFASENAQAQTSSELLELQEINSKFEDLAEENPHLFTWDPSQGTFGVAAEVLFRPGKASLLFSGKKALNKLVPILQESPEIVRIDGHSDSDPIKHSKWEDNWQLSAERARRVLKYLLKQGIEGNRLFFAGFADTRPRALNASTEGRRANRRVELVPLPAKAAALPTSDLSMSK